MPGSLILLCRFPAKRSLESLTSLCKHSHVFNEACQGRLLLPKGNNCSFTHKQFIRGARGTKLGPHQHYESDSSLLVKHFLLTATVCGCSFTGAMIWEYENIKKKIQAMKQQLYFNHGVFKNHFIEVTNLVSGIVVINAVVYVLWKVPRIYPFMQRYFLCSPCKEQSVLGSFFAAFSHENFIHLFCNMYVLLSFSTVTLSMFGKEQFLGVYLSGAAVSSFVSMCNKVAWKIPTPSVGASGAICALIGATCLTYPDSQLSIAFIDQIIPHSFSAQSGLLGLLTFDILGVVFRWRFFDHAAHLGGALFGIWYVKYGQDLIWKKREAVIKWWHNKRKSSN